MTAFSPTGASLATGLDAAEAVAAAAAAADDLPSSRPLVGRTQTCTSSSSGSVLPGAGSSMTKNLPMPMSGSVQIETTYGPLRWSTTIGSSGHDCRASS